MRLPSVSPSVYIAYHELQAFISCPNTGYIARGEDYNTTIAYAPEELSASMSARAHQTCAFSEINYTGLANYPFRNATDFILSLPSALSSVDPVWSTCAPAAYGAFDPPAIMQRATALTDPAKKSTQSMPAAPGGHVGPAHGPSTMTSAVASSDPGVSQAVPRPAVPRTTNSQRSNPTEAVDTAISQGSYHTLASQSPSNTPSNASRGKSKISDPDDPTNTSAVPEKHGLDSGDHTANKESAVFQNPVATATAIGKDGLNPTLRLAGSTVASAPQPISYSNDFLHVGGFHPMTGGSTRLVQQNTLTLHSGISVSPSGHSDEVSTGSQIVHVPNVPAATQKVQFDSSRLTSVITAPIAPGHGNPHTTAFAIANISMTAGANMSRTSAAHGNGSTVQIHTGGNERSIHGLWTLVAVCLSVAVTVTALSML